MTRTEKRNGREDQLQFLRFLAFLNVYLVHTDDWLSFFYPTAYSGNSAVSFFFILSGLVAGLSCFEKKENFTLREYGAYMWKRIVKIYPLHFLATLLSVIYSAIPQLVGANNLEALKEPLVHLLKHLLLIQSWFPLDDFAFNGASWFLSTLIFLTALNLPMSVILNKVRKIRYGYLLMLGATLGLAFTVVVYCYFTKNWEVSYWHYKFPPARVAEYLIGMVWGFMLRNVKRNFNPNGICRGFFTIAELFSLIFWYMMLFRPGSPWRSHIVTWLKPNVILLVVFTCGYGWVSDLFRKRVFVRLGDLSFGCYLLHGIIVKSYRAIQGYDLPSIEAKMFAFVFCLMASIILANNLYRSQK